MREGEEAVRVPPEPADAGRVEPYEVGGDWFDFVENHDGAWLAIAEAAGTGPTVAGLGASVLGALRAARRSGDDLAEALHAMDETVRGLGNADFHVTAIVARWHASTSTFTWANCGHTDAMVVDTDGNLSTLEGPIHAPLGTPGDQPTFQLTERQMASGERLILVTDGITERHTDTGGRFGLDGIRGAIEGVESATAAACAMAILQAVSDCCRDPLEDDGTVVILGVA